MRTVTIKSGCIGRYDDASPFLLESGVLDLNIVLPSTVGEFFLVSKLNGKIKAEKTFIRRGEPIRLNVEPGELLMEVKHYLRGAIVESIKVEPLLIKEVDGTVYAFPEIKTIHSTIENLKKDLADQKKEFDEFKKSYEQFVAESEKQEKRHNEMILKEIDAVRVALLRFSWACYRADVFLNTKNLNEKEFVRLLGFEPDESVLGEINKKQEDF